MIITAKVSETTKALAKKFNAQIAEDLIIKIKSHCCMLGITTPCVKVFDEQEGFTFIMLDTFIRGMVKDDISVDDLCSLRVAERYYLNKIVAKKAHVQVSYETYLENEVQKYIRNHTAEFLNKR